MHRRQRMLEQISPFLGKPVIKVITGLRRTGKSTILKLLIAQLKRNGVPDRALSYLNMESMGNDACRNRDTLFTAIKERAKSVEQPLVVILDEVQEIEGWQRLVNTLLADQWGDVIITGSNARLLSGEMATLLSGRYVQFRVYPLSFPVYREFRQSKQTEEQDFREFITLIFRKM